jgi:Leucine-rich repeat (LRR) protein
MKRIAGLIDRFPGKFFKNLDEASLDTTQIGCYATADNYKKLRRFKQLKQLFLSTGKDGELLSFVDSRIEVESLTLMNFQVADLSPLENLTNIQTLILHWNNKATRLWNFERMKTLRGLSIVDLKRLREIDELQKCTWLEQLYIGGGIVPENYMQLQSLESLRTLQNLVYLHLGNVRVLEKGLEPIGNLKNLQELDTNYLFDTEDYARLSVLLKNTKCDAFAPFVKLKHPIGDKDIRIVGKRKPFLNSVRDKERIEEYVVKFKKLQEKYEFTDHTKD